MIIEQIDLVDVKKAPVRPGQKARIEGPFPLSQGLFQIQSTHHPIFRSAKGQIDHGHRGPRTLFLAPGPAGLTGPTLPGGIAAVGTALHHRHAWQQGREAAHRRGFSRAAIPEDHDAPKTRIHHRQEQGLLHPVLGNDGGKGIGNGHESLLRRGGRRALQTAQDWKAAPRRRPPALQDAAGPRYRARAPAPAPRPPQPGPKPRDNPENPLDTRG